LISFWYDDLAKAKAGMKAFVVNRIGDFGFILGLFALLWGLGGSWVDSPKDSRLHRDHYQQVSGFAPLRGVADERPSREGLLVGPTVSFKELHDQMAVESTGVLDHLKTSTFFGFHLIAVICILFFVGATGKSAQLPLYVWLPDAMAGPTPVSALIHAATMVTAGVYMVARLNFLFALSPVAMTLVACTGAATALFAATIGFFQYDIKKVLAYSTVSQLGFMFIGVGVGAFWAGSYHLLTHAFFKACLFLASGSVILACHHEQDMRKMGGLRHYTPLTRWTYALACIAISGFPVMSGFFSKDEILWKAFTTENLLAPWIGQLIAVIGLITAGGTSFYMWRSYYLTFWAGEYKGGAAAHGHGAAHEAEEEEPGDHGAATPHESPAVMTYVLVALAAGAFLASFLGIPKAWTGSDPLLEKFLEPVTSLSAPWLHFTEYGVATDLAFMLISVSIATLGWSFARQLYQSGDNPLPAQLLQRFPRTHTLIFNKYYVDEIYAATVIRLVMITKDLLGWFDGAIVDGLVNLAARIIKVVGMVDGAIDKYFVDGLVNLLSNAILAGGQGLRRIQTGRLENYLFGALAGALAFVAVNYLVH
jgi:NADH-quinone oxidoreductase subunit L